MKKIFYLLLIAAAIVTACQPKTESVSIDAKAEKDSIAKNLDVMYSAFTTKDAKAFLPLLTEDCLYCGTDSKEFWDKGSYSKFFNEMSADTSYKAPTLTLNKREIRLDKSGTSAIAVDQLFVSGWSDKIPLRNVTHLVKIDNKWMCDFVSMSLVPNNEDLEKIFHAVKE
jgi:ketosteroid isomerase-like protein